MGKIRTFSSSCAASLGAPACVTSSKEYQFKTPSLLEAVLMYYPLLLAG